MTDQTIHKLRADEEHVEGFARIDALFQATGRIESGHEFVTSRTLEHLGKLGSHQAEAAAGVELGLRSPRLEPLREQDHEYEFRRCREQTQLHGSSPSSGF